MTRTERVARACRSCDALPRVRVTHAESHRLPATWRPIEEHPALSPGPWVPSDGMKGIVFCESCLAIWYLFLDPGRYYYTDVIELEPGLASIVSEDATLADVMPVAAAGDALLQLMVRDWFALAEHDRSESATALVGELARPELSLRCVLRLLDFLTAVLAGAPRDETVHLEDSSPLLALIEREDLVSLDPVRQASERTEMHRLLAGVVRVGFGSAFGARGDRIRTTPKAREALVSFARSRRAVGAAPVLAPSAGTLQPMLGRIEYFITEIEELVRDGARRFTPQEIAPIIDVVRSFWAVDADERAFAPGWDPGLVLYRRCRDLLFALRHANLIPSDCEQAVAEALDVP
jgi:hypothetical protein